MTPLLILCLCLTGTYILAMFSFRSQALQTLCNPLFSRVVSMTASSTDTKRSEDLIETSERLHPSRQGRIRTFAGADFMLLPEGEDPRPNPSSSSPMLLTVIPIRPGEPITNLMLRSILESTGSDLDTSFTDHIVFNGATQAETSIEQSTQISLDSRGANSCEFVKEDLQVSGPLVSEGNKFWRPWKLHEDFNNAFMISFWPVPHQATNHSYEIFDTVSTSSKSLKVPIPQRLSTETVTGSRPLEGIRIAVKDCYDVRGTRTSLCNQAYLDLYPDVDETAEAIEQLVDGGAVLLGKLKLCSFIGKEDPTEAIDFPAPFNPRADGYQSPSGSSTGSATAIASYDWSDVTIGSDTNGSGRRPSNVNGCFGIRPSAGLVSKKGLVPSFERFDVPYIFSRNVRFIFRIIHHFNEIRREQRSTADKIVNRLIYPTDILPTANSVQMELIEAFVQDLEQHLNIRRTELNIADLWQKTPPKDAGDEPVSVYLKNAGWEPVFYDNAHNLDQFRADYASKFHKTPYATPYNRWKWENGLSVSLEKREWGMHRFEVFKTWMLREVFQLETHNGLMILPIDTPIPTYRDAQPLPLGDRWRRNGYQPIHFSPILGAPELTVPIGEFPYISDISGREEYLPVGISILGIPDSDMTLLDTIERMLQRSGRPSEVLTGRRMFSAEADQRQKRTK